MVVGTDDSKEEKLGISGEGRPAPKGGGAREQQKGLHLIFCSSGAGQGPLIVCHDELLSIKCPKLAYQPCL